MPVWRIKNIQLTDSAGFIVCGNIPQAVIWSKYIQILKITILSYDRCLLFLTMISACFSLY